MLLDNPATQRISDNILSLYDWILAVSIMDMRGNILAAKSKQSFKDTFGVIRDGEESGGTLAFTILSLVNQVRDVFGDTQAIITIHKNCKLMQLPMQSYEILVGLVIHSSANAEDGQIAKTLKHHCKPPAEH
jgi:hypothetical protein